MKHKSTKYNFYLAIVRYGKMLKWLYHTGLITGDLFCEAMYIRRKVMKTSNQYKMHKYWLKVKKIILNATIVSRETKILTEREFYEQNL